MAEGESEAHQRLFGEVLLDPTAFLNRQPEAGFLQNGLRLEREAL
jgi:hypothetical protein